MKTMKRLFRKVWESYKEAMTIYGEAIIMSKSI